MLYNICLHADPKFFVPALTITITLVVITFIKEKRDERKRA
jgi:hypothetical protein